MSDAFVHGSIGEIPLAKIPAARGKAFWPHHEQVLAADLYETEFPGVTVIRPWESKEQHEARKALRKPVIVAEPELNMDPARAEPELRRRQIELAGLTIDHPEYEKLFTAQVRNIHQLEHILGRAPTRYAKGTVPKKKEDPVSTEHVEALAKYKKLPEAKRRAAIQNGENPELLALVRDNETEPALQTLAMQRIVELSAVPA